MGQAKKRAVEIDGRWLDPIPPELRKQAVEEAESGDAIGFLIKASNVYSLDLVFWNEGKLRRLGLFEEALLHALIIPALNSYRWPLSFLRSWLARADRKRLREAGDVLPSDGPFTCTVVLPVMDGHGACAGFRGQVLWRRRSGLLIGQHGLVCRSPLCIAQWCAPMMFSRIAINETSRNLLCYCLKPFAPSEYWIPPL